MKRIRKSLVKGLILGTVFIVSIILFSNVMNKDLAEELTDMSRPTMPVVYMEMADMLANPMYGNTKEMQPKFYRESIMPLSTKREMKIAIDAKAHTIQGVSYRVTSADGVEIIEDGKLGKLKENNGYIKAEFALENRILMDQEYMLCFIVDYGMETPAYYYTRIVQRAGLNASQYLNFVRDFYEKCMSKETATGLTQYIEPDDQVMNTSYTKINIHSSYDQLTWGKLSPKLTCKAVPTIKEINATTCSISQNYEISTQDTEGNTEYYYVEEFYRMRYSQSRVMLLDFERSVQQYFDANLPVLTSQGLNLGIADTNISYTTNQNADIVAFVQNGELWSYNRSANKAAHVFGFRGNLAEESEDIRVRNMEHRIKIVNIHESGDIDFVVYGYMNCGDHEGSTGVAVYRYSAERNVTEEQVFIPGSISAEFMQDDANRLTYVNQSDHLYLIMENHLFHVDIPNKTYEMILENINPECLVVSKSQNSIAWMDQMEEHGSTSLTFMNLETGAQSEVKAPSGEKVKVLGFMNEDLLYGFAKDQDIVTDAAGNVIFAMHKIFIQNFAGEVIKEYGQENVWVNEVILQEGLAELCRVERSGDVYVSINSENIMNNLQKSEETVNIHLSVTERKGTTVALDFSKKTQSKKILFLEADYVDLQDDVTVAVEIPENTSQLYYVYAGGKLYGTAAKPNQAIKMADEVAGVVLNTSQQYIWERGNKQDKELIQLVEVPEAVQAATLDESALSQALGEDYHVLNLTGCTLDSVLYQVSEGRAVVALTSTGESVAIVGYDMYNTILCNPVTRETYYYGINDSTALFKGAGNVFISYIKTLESRRN